ncbi:MAG TPA: hypothetical protein VD948_07965 [Rhodothermales bacterium]|nr:hypothetical protein [Rhodothermales bacterium]
MPQIRIYRHPECARCARIARLHQALDWLGRIETSTATPPSGPLRKGEVVVEDLATGQIRRGAEAFALITRQVPLYAPLRLLLHMPAFRRYVELDMSGCRNGACDVEPVPARS